MRFAIAGEGLTDYTVLKNLLIGFFNDKNLPTTRLLPEDKEPVGWGNVSHFLASERFRKGVLNADYTIVQIDTGTCQDWNENIEHIGDDVSKVEAFIQTVIGVLKRKIGDEFYEQYAAQILFAVTVHDMECWLLPFNEKLKNKQAKIVGCFNALEAIANKQGFSLHQKNFEESKHYEKLSADMKKQKTLFDKAHLNISLHFFIEQLKVFFPAA